MRRLFRTSRQYLFGKGTIKNYILYSIGEVALVVIGILIALSIDNWNDERKDISKEQQILTQLRDEFKSNLLQLEEKISTRRSMIQACQKVLKDIDNPDMANRDSLITRLARQMNDPTFDPIINDLIGSGNIRLIRNEQLKRLLTNWSSDVIALQEVEKRWTKIVDELVVPSYVKLGIARDGIDRASNNELVPFALDKLTNNLTPLGQSNRSPTTTEILANRDLEGIISVSIGLNQSGNIQSYALQSRIIKIVSLLNEEIN